MKENKKERAFYRFFTAVTKFLLVVLEQPRIYGKENIPTEGRLIIASNHICFIDPVLIIKGTKRQIHFLAKSDLFKGRFLGWVFTNMGLIPVHRERRDKDAMNSARDILNNDGVIGIFPEGKTNKVDRKVVQPLKMGAVKMAYDTHSPIVVATINGRYIPFFTKLSVTFQEPYYIESDDLEAEREKLYQKISSNIKK
ncbi:MAG: lysophospholipid acyltransferase family protein [Acutalibacteraceae bacterium]